MNQEKVGILIDGKKLNASRREFLSAASVLNDGELSVTVFGNKKSKAKRYARQAGLEFVKLKGSVGETDFNASLKFTKVLKDQGISTVLFRHHRFTNLLVTAKFLMKGRLRLVLVQDRPLEAMNADFLHTFRFNQIDAWITPLSQTANAVKSGTSLSHDKLHVFPLPIPRKPFLFDDEERKLRKSILFGSDETIVVGWTVPDDETLVRRTGQKLVELLKAKGEIKACLNKKGMKMKELLALVPELGEFKESIRITPFHHHDGDMFAHLDAVFLDSEIEPFAGIASRALLAGVLPLAPKSLLTDELLVNGLLGLVYTQQGGPGELSRAGDKVFLSAFRTKGQEYAGEKYTKKRFKENLEALIHSLPKKAKAR